MVVLLESAPVRTKSEPTRPPVTFCLVAGERHMRIALSLWTRPSPTTNNTNNTITPRAPSIHDQS